MFTFPWWVSCSEKIKIYLKGELLYSRMPLKLYSLYKLQNILNYGKVWYNACQNVNTLWSVIEKIFIAIFYVLHSELDDRNCNQWQYIYWIALCNFFSSFDCKFALCIAMHSI